MLFCDRKQIIFGSLVEDVVDHLYRVDESGGNDIERRIGLVVIDGHSGEADLAVALQIFKRPFPFIAVNPARVPDVQLLKVDRVDAQIPETLLGRANDIVIGEHVGNVRSRRCRPDSILGRYLCRDVHATRSILDDLTDEHFAMPVAIGEGRVDKVQAKFERASESEDGFIIRATFPLFAADAPGAVADLANFETSPAEFSVSHETIVLPAPKGTCKQPAGRSESQTRRMIRAIALLMLAAGLLGAATVRLYMKDGSYHSVSEYETKGDRVRYYSTERSEWEEIPLDLVDLKRTESEKAAREASRREDAAALDAEEKAERAQRREIERIPVNPGVYIVQGEQITTLKQAEVKSVNNKRRSVLKAISPIPMVAGKSTVELDGLKAALTLQAERPEFYFRLYELERLAIVRMKPAKSSRIVQTLNMVPVSNEIVEDTDIVETFKQQIAEGLYKIWPTKPLEPGEYAVVEYTEGKGNIQVWDFAVAR